MNRFAAAAAALLCLAAPAALAQTALERAAAAATSAATTHADCTNLPSFYWEIGEASGEPLAFGARGTYGGLVNTPEAMRVQDLGLDSAGKWLYGAYVVQKRHDAGVALGTADIDALRMRSGYSFTYQCTTQTTVQACHEAGDYSVAPSPPTAGAHNATRKTGTPPQPDTRYYYASGHFQKHAVDMGLGSIDETLLDDEVRGVLGTAIPSAYDTPALASGARGSAAGYAGFLQKLLHGDLAMSTLLGSHATCADSRAPKDCGADDPQYSPASSPVLGTDEHWFYALGYWIEDDPAAAVESGDGAFSSAGASGFYPWIDRAQKYYGLVAREATPPFAAFASAKCGRAIRAAWMSEAP